MTLHIYSLCFPQLISLEMTTLHESLALLSVCNSNKVKIHMVFLTLLLMCPASTKRETRLLGVTACALLCTQVLTRYLERYCTCAHPEPVEVLKSYAISDFLSCRKWSLRETAFSRSNQMRLVYFSESPMTVKKGRECTLLLRICDRQRRCHWSPA